MHLGVPLPPDPMEELERNKRLTEQKQYRKGQDCREKEGTFEFYCAVPGHREAGQVGTLLVE